MTLHCTVNYDVTEDTCIFTSVGTESSSEHLAPANFTYKSCLWYFCPWQFGRWEQFDCLELWRSASALKTCSLPTNHGQIRRHGFYGATARNQLLQNLHQVLTGITLDIRAGKTTAIVGKSGCGKSTMSNSTSQGFVRNYWKYVTGKVVRVQWGVILNHVQSVWMIFYPR